MNTITSTSSDVGRPRLPELARSDRLVQRMRAEFLEMPGLMLTLPQAARLWSLQASQAKAALGELVAGGFLVWDSRGMYRRRGACPRCS